MTKEEKLEFLKECYEKAKSTGKVHNKSDFARFLGKNRSVISAVFSGNEKYLTDVFMSRLRDRIEELDVEETALGEKVYISRETMQKAYTLIAKSINSMASALDTLTKEFNKNDTKEDSQDQETH